jgi:hypothetical protein
MDFKETGWEVVDRIHLATVSSKRGSETSGSTTGRNFD